MRFKPFARSSTHCMGVHRSSAGFTLVEIMVAIAILGALGVVLISSANSSTRDLAAMENKLEALSIADYAINQILIADDIPDYGTEEDVITRAGRRWLLQVTVSETLNERVRRVDALVKPYETLGTSEERQTILLSGFKTDLSAQ